MTETYTVQPGDTLNSIAQQFCSDASQANHIYELNRQVIGDNPNNIKVGQELTVICCDSSTRQITPGPGSSSTTVEGVLSAACTANFVINGRAGQFMAIVLTSPGPTHYTLAFPGGNSEGQTSGQGGVIFQQTLSKTGDYSIRLAVDQAQAAGKFILTVVIHTL